MSDTFSAGDFDIFDPATSTPYVPQESFKGFSYVPSEAVEFGGGETYDPSSFKGYSDYAGQIVGEGINSKAYQSTGTPRYTKDDPVFGRESSKYAMVGQGTGSGTGLGTQGSALNAPASTTDKVQSWLGKLMDGDKSVSNQAKLGMGALGLLASLMQKKKGASIAATQQKGKFDQWNPQQRAAFDNYFNTPLPTMRKGYAQGGLAMAGAAPEGPPMMPPEAMGAGPEAMGAGPEAPFAGFVEGAEGGQSDIVPVNLSPGEYVMDAETVSMIGDGNTNAGAALLDQWREELRGAKRDAPPDEIPPASADVAGPLGQAMGGMQ